LRNSVIHVLERRSFRRAAVLLPWCPQAMASLPPEIAPTVSISPPIAESNGSTSSLKRERLVVAYTPEPWGKGLELVCRTWSAVDGATDARLQIMGITPERGLEYLDSCGLKLPAGAEFPGMVTQDEFHEILGRTSVFLSGARWEDFGLAPLEALDLGATLVAAPGAGPFPALAVARSLEPRFVGADLSPAALAASLQAALSATDEELAQYRARALTLLAPYRRDHIVERLRDDVLPRLLL
jgi:hypothetical protein